MERPWGFLNTYREEILKCTSCGFCQAACPVFGATLRPAYNTRGKMLILREVLQGFIELSPDLADTFYTCTTCGACTNSCPRHIRAAEVVVEVRRGLYAQALAPAEMMGLTNRISRTGNVFAASREERTRIYPSWLKERAQPREKAETLLFMGCLPSYLDMKIVPDLVRILDAAKVRFNTLAAEENCCGFPLYLAGSADFKPHAEKLLQKLQATGARELVTPCAGCYKTFSTLYSELGDLGISVYHSVQYLDRLVREGRMALTKGEEMRVTYHDPCDLGRACNIFEEPRSLLKSIPGVELVEMSGNRMDARCCGGGGNLQLHHPELALEMGAKRVRDALAVGAQIIVSGCPACKDNLRKGARLIPKEERGKIRIVDVTEVVSKHQRGRLCSEEKSVSH